MARARLAIGTTTGGTTSPPPGVYEYDLGTSVTVRAIPSSGYSFDLWVKNTRSVGTWFKENPITITVNEDTDLVAYFAPPVQGKVKLTIKADPQVGGTTNPSPGEYIVDSGGFREVVARPEPSFGFDKWTLDGTVMIVNPAYIYVNRDYTITAHFGYGWLEVHAYEDSREANYPVTVMKNGVIVGSGNTPYKELFPIGTYEVIVAGEKKTAVVENGKTTRVDFYFKIPPPPTMAEIYIAAYYDNTEVAADYEVREYYTNRLVASGKTPVWPLKVDPGTYIVKCTYAGQTQEKLTGYLGPGMASFATFYFGAHWWGTIEVHFYADGKEVVQESEAYFHLYTSSGVDLGKFYTPTKVNVVPDTYIIKATFYGQEQTKTVKVDAGQQVKVEFTFERLGVSILIIKTTTGGTTDPEPGQYQYPTGSTVTVTAIPDSGYNFNYWDVNGTKNTSNPITLTLKNNVTLTAFFKKTALPPTGFPLLTWGVVSIAIGSLMLYASKRKS